MPKPLLAFALAQESQDVFDGYNVLYTGVGKVNAAYALTRHLLSNDPKIVVNLGTAGSRKHAGGTIVNATSFVQRDMDVTPLGFAPYQTPFSDDPAVIEYGMKIDGLPQGRCGTGDNFDITDRALEFDVVDMEAYALALICQRENIPFLSLKYVSDGADDGADVDWNKALHVAALALKNILEEIKI